MTPNVPFVVVQLTIADPVRMPPKEPMTQIVTVYLAIGTMEMKPVKTVTICVKPVIMVPPVKLVKPLPLKELVLVVIVPMDIMIIML